VSDKKYVLMKWKDGWQEVIRIEGDALGFDKYFVIERKEYFGRLVYKMPEGDYPGLIVIDRAPMEIEKIVMLEGEDEKRLKQVSAYQEGDRTEHHFEMGNGEDSLIGDVSKNVNQALADKGISAKDILSLPDPEKFKELEAIARKARIVGGRNQEDLAGFVQLILEKI
jgi:hypothetical protein